MGDGLLNKLKTLVGFEDIEDFDEDYEEEIVDEPQRTAQRKSYGLSSGSARSNNSNGGTDRENVISMQNKTLNAITTQFKIVVIEPKSFDECPKLVDSLKGRKPVIINLEKIETDTARKIFDFLSGATYALNGNVQKIANNIFVFLPENVDVSTDTNNKGVTFGKDDYNPWR